MPRIFISYRLGDGDDEAELIYNRLAQAFGTENVIMDAHLTTPATTDLREVVLGCSVMLVIIGKFWASIIDENGGNLIDDPYDHVFVEVEAGLKSLMWLTPILVDNGEIPPADKLPPSLRELPHRDAIRVGEDIINDLQFGRLIERLQTEVADAPDITSEEVPHEETVAEVFSESQPGTVPSVPNRQSTTDDRTARIAERIVLYLGLTVIAIVWTLVTRSPSPIVQMPPCNDIFCFVATYNAAETAAFPRRTTQAAAVIATMTAQPQQEQWAMLSSGVAFSLRDANNIARGRRLFTTFLVDEHTCWSCHSNGSTGGVTGPSLEDIRTIAAQRVDGQTTVPYLYSAITAPDDYLVAGYETNLMPENYGTLLSEEGLYSLIAYLLTL